MRIKADTRGSNIVYWTVAISDILILTSVYMMFIYWFWMSKDVPQAILHRPRASLYICFFAAFAAETFVPPIIHHRRVKIMDIVIRVVKMCILHVFLFVALEKLYMGTVEGMFAIITLYFAAILFVMLAKRMTERTILNRLRRSGYNSKAVVFIGGDDANGLIYQDMTLNSSTGYNVLGYYSNNRIKNIPDEVEKLGTLDEFISAIEQGEHPVNCEEIYCSLSHSDEIRLNSVMKYCDQNLIRFFFVPRIYGSQGLNLSPIEFGEYTLFTNHSDNISRLDSRIIKRLFDIVFSSIMLICLIPFIPLIWLMIRMQSRGPLFFGQERTGIGGKTFKCWKFRSMHVNSDSDSLQATKDDPRKFPFGNFIRRTNIDELPQFYNVLKGDMSVVGPRPHMIHHTDVYSQLIEKYMVRHFSKPGITGWAQITGFRGETQELWQMEERIKRDIWYNEHWSLSLDIEIILRTIWSVFHPDAKAY